MLNVIEARYLHDHMVWLRFNDGLEGEVDLAPELEGEIFEPLRERKFFAQVRLDAEVRTIVWPNGADFAPEFLHSLIRVAA